MLNMSIINKYVQELVTLNAKHLGGVAGFRTWNVSCIDKFGREICFFSPDEIENSIYRLMTVFSEEFQNAADIFSLSRSFAKFYYGFIAIHPFPNANRRTAFTFLENRANDKAYRIVSIELLQKILLEGSVATEMQKLMILFSEILKPQPQHKESKNAKT